jgi:hypothetical protein
LNTVAVVPYLTHAETLSLRLRFIG